MAAANGDRKSTGSNFGCALRCEFFSHSFSQSSSDGTVTSACFAYARCTALELWPNACCAMGSDGLKIQARLIERLERHRSQAAAKRTEAARQRAQAWADFLGAIFS